jgi:SAM-dependent methyltransferase
MYPSTGGRLRAVTELWRLAEDRVSEFDAIAVDYKRYRPRYPERLFDDIVETGELSQGARAVEIGAGTGIATAPLVDRGLIVTALEPAPGMAALARAKLGNRARVEVSRFEDWTATEAIQLVAAFNAWHWVQPDVGLGLAAQMLTSGGTLAIVWTDVISWGEEPFETRLADAFGAPWPKTVDQVVGSLGPVQEDGRFGAFQEHHYRFERRLDAADFVAVTRTYGGTHSTDRDEIIRTIIDEELGGTVTKVEDAVLNLARRQ